LFISLIFPFAPSQALAEEDDILFYLDAVSKIQENALQLKTGTERKKIVRATLRAYLKSLDRFSAYLTPEEYASFRASQKSRYIGVGMEIEMSPSSQIICMPYPDGPAKRAGIQFGDILESIDGVDVSGKSLIAVVTEARGEEGTEVALKVLSKNQSKTIRVKREKIRSTSVRTKWHDTIPVLTISSFRSSTQRELKKAFTELGNTSPIVIDLRGNPGGDLHSAIDSAMLFLEKGKKIVDIKTRKGLKSYKSTTIPVNASSPLYLWQDKRTASAAEVFIAALTQNERAKSIGKITFGKGTMQDIIELIDGSALFLTTGYLQTPAGNLYHDQGLEPTYSLHITSPATSHYITKVRDLIGQHTFSDPTSSGKTNEKQVNISPALKVRTPEMANSVAPFHPARKPENPSETYFICFDKDFDTEDEADIWSSGVRRSFNTVLEQYLLQRRKPERIKFIVCLGGFRIKDKAEKERLRMSEATNISMFIKVIKHKDFNVDASKSLNEDTY